MAATLSIPRWLSADLRQNISPLPFYCFLFEANTAQIAEIIASLISLVAY